MGDAGNRAKTIEAMDTVIRSMSHEEAYEDWIHFVPDDAEKDDFEDIASDRELFETVCGIFPEIVARYARDGWD